MRKNILMLISATILIFLIPFVSAITYNIINSKAENPEKSTSQPVSIGQTLKIYNHKTQNVIEMDFEEYIVGVLIGEMPASYELEALKAQAVAARSYILSKAEQYNSTEYTEVHKGAAICTNPDHCKAWMSVEEANSKWGDDWSEKYSDKIKRAVNETKGEYMTYANQTVKAFFFASSNGKTENSEDVWNTSLPYLKSVESFGDAENSENESSVELSKDEFVQKLKDKYSDIKIPEDLRQICENITHTDGGNVKTVTLGGKEFKGTEIRSLFNLRSASFSINISDDCETVRFDVKGYGHGVGMSQYGANFMAKQGKNYKDILTHYYSGVEFSNISEIQ